uniref:Coiled-coil domain-containing protein 12 n=1 Tax=Globodera rostochiensis TaxID=31243 RepID=A0A914HXS1_GLORO
MDVEELVVEQSLSELEQNAMARRQRLMEFRAKFANNEQFRKEGEEEEGDGSRGTEEPVSLLFRSYKRAKDSDGTEKVPQPHFGKTQMEIGALEKNISDQLEASEDTKIHDELDLKTLAPRKVDWDLRRGLQEKMDKLERRTKKAINQLIRQRVDEGVEGQLAAAVDSVGEGR